MVIIMRASGRKIYNMGRAYRSTRIKMSTTEDLCVEASSERGNIDSQMGEYIKDLSITAIVMGMVS